MFDMGDKPTSELLSALQSLYRSRDYADLVIYCKDGTKHLVHRSIVCPRSHYFDQIVKQGQWREDNEGEIALLDDEPEVARLLIEYFYLLDYEAVSVGSSEDTNSYGESSDSASVRTEAGQYLYGSSALSAFGGPQNGPYSVGYRSRAESALTVHALPDAQLHGTFGRQNHSRRKSNRVAPEISPLASAEPNLVLHARMYAAGYKYGINGLKALALDKFKIQLTRHWDNHEFAEAIHVVYNTTPSTDKDMRETVADTIDWHSRLLDKHEIEFAIMEINGLAYELLKRSRRADPEYVN